MILEVGRKVVVSLNSSIYFSVKTFFGDSSTLTPKVFQ